MKTIINTPKAPEPLGPYNQAILSGDTLYISGQIPLDVETKTLVDTSIEDATEQVMKNLKVILEEVDMTFENVVKTSIFIADMDNFHRINEVYASYFNEQTAPARETVQVARLPKESSIEISMIAVR